METRKLDIKTPDGVCDSYIACPDGKGPFPAVLIFMDGVGIRPELYRMADRFAAAGYFTLLPNMFYRGGRAETIDQSTVLLPENIPKLMERVMSLTPERVVRDAGAFLDFLDAQKQVRPGKISLTGYCMGGAMVMHTAAHYPDRVVAGTSYHGGGLFTDAPDSPHRLAGRIRARLYFGHADQDPFMTAEQIANLHAALDAAGTKYRGELYQGALHGFTMSDLPAFNAAANERHWQTMLALFGEAQAA